MASYKLSHIFQQPATFGKLRRAVKISNLSLQAILQLLSMEKRAKLHINTRYALAITKRGVTAKSSAPPRWRTTYGRRAGEHTDTEAATSGGATPGPGLSYALPLKKLDMAMGAACDI